MKCKSGGYDFVVKWEHIYTTRQRKYKNEFRLEKHPSATICTVHIFHPNADIEIRKGIASVYYKDNFSRKVGRRISMMKALIDSSVNEYVILDLVKQHEQLNQKA